METRGVLALVAALAALSLTACDKASDSPAREPARASSSSSASSDDAVASRSGDRDDPRDAPVARVDGKPMWAANRRYTAEENAKYQFEQHGKEFDANDQDDFVKKVHAFVGEPPKGVEKIKRSNGDTLMYDRKGNVFAVVTDDGAPRTMFKPKEGPAYWDQQKQRETARANTRSDRDEG